MSLYPSQPQGIKDYIHHFHQDHNAPHLIYLHPPSKKKNCITTVFDYSWDNCNTHEKLETMAMQNFVG